MVDLEVGYTLSNEIKKIQPFLVCFVHKDSLLQRFTIRTIEGVDATHKSTEVTPTTERQT